MKLSEIELSLSIKSAELLPPHLLARLVGSMRLDVNAHPSWGKSFRDDTIYGSIDSALESFSGRLSEIETGPIAGALLRLAVYNDAITFTTRITMNADMARLGIPVEISVYPCDD